MNWSVTSRQPVSTDRWAQIEVRNHFLHDMWVPQARLVGRIAWYNISIESSGDILSNLQDGKIINSNITYRAFNSEYITLTSECGDVVTRIAVKGRVAKTFIGKRPIVLY